MNINSKKKQAWVFFNENKFAEAIQLCEQIREANTADAEILYLLGCCHRRTGEYSDAVISFQDCLKIRPDAPVTLLMLGKVLVKLERYGEAIKNFKLALRFKPDMYKAHLALANALSSINSASEARQHYKKAIKLKPDRVQPQIGLASLEWNTEKNLEQAIKHFNAAIELQPLKISHRCMLGNALMEGLRIEDSFTCYRDAHKIEPDSTWVIAGLARLYNIKGQYEKSMEHIDLLSSKKIYHPMAAIAFTSICKHLNNCEDALKYAKKTLELKQSEINVDEALIMHIARVLDSLGRYDEAWHYFTMGNKITEQLYDTVNQRLLTENMTKVFSHASMMSMPKSTNTSKRPIFVVGMPRSGTSLVEQILSAHPDVCGGGELTYVSDIRSLIIYQAGPDKVWPGCVQELTQEDLDKWAQYYLEKINGISESAVRITDKMPHNFSEVGFIKMLFPQAKIIHCNRDPRDTCLSIYFQNFLDGHDYSRNLYHVGAHYHEYLKLMAHWRSNLTMPFLDVQYEELVSNPEVVVRQMLKHCNLEWYDGCLDFHKVKRQVHTASFDQVRQPMYKRSVQRWRHYEKYLAPLEEGLEHGL